MTPDGSVDVSVILPALNEAENLVLLVPLLARVLAGGRFEMVVVDDGSNDGTVQVCADLSRRFPLRLLQRSGAKDGLSGAVLAGLSQAEGRLLVVMDADLQHPAEAVPQMVAMLEAGKADFVIGSRHAKGAATDVSWGNLRKLNSAVARTLAWPVCGAIGDPMSGFFAMTRQTWLAATNLAPLGYKICLEFLAKVEGMRVVEIPIHFGVRKHGKSKLSLREQFRYLEHLSRLYDHRHPRLSPVGKFLITYAMSCAFALPVFLLMVQRLNWTPAAVILSMLVSTGLQALLHWRYLGAERSRLASRHPWMEFFVMVAVETVLAWAVACWLMEQLRWPVPLKVFLITFMVTAVARYILRKELRYDIRMLKSARRA